MGRFFNFIVRLLVIKDLLDTQAGLKGFRREAATEIFKRTTLKRFSFDVEVLFIAKREGMKIAEIPVVWNNGKSTTVGLSAFFDSLLQLIFIRWWYR